PGDRRCGRPATAPSLLVWLWIRLVVLVDLRVHVLDGGIERRLSGGLSEQDRLDHLLCALAGLRHDAQDRAVGEAVLRRITDLGDGREELRVLRRPILAGTLVVRG